MNSLRTNYFVPASSNVGSGGLMNRMSSPMVSFVIVVVFFVLMVVYHKTIGYYITTGWSRVKDMMHGGATQVDMEMGPGEPGESSAVSATIAPMPSPEDRPSGMPGASSNSTSLSFSSLMSPLNTPIGHRKEVFNVSRNIYTFHDAAAVCSAAGSELATYDQVKEAYEGGADWCNYGWVKGQMAVYPTQKETYEKLQKSSPEYRRACGDPGVNGGYFDNPELRFGVNCYGIKPAKKASDELLESQVALPPSPDQIEFEKQVQKFREQMDTSTILPFRKGQWSN